MAGMSEGVETRFRGDVRHFVEQQAKPLYASLGRMEVRTTRASNLSSRFREAARQRRSAEFEKLATAARRLIRHNQRLRSLPDDDLFKSIVNEQEFLRFFATVDTEVKLAEERVAEPEPGSDSVGAAADVEQVASLLPAASEAIAAVAAQRAPSADAP